MRMTWLLPILLAFLPAAGSAIEIKAGTIDESHRIDVLSGGPDRTELRFQVGNFRLEPVSVDGASYSRIAWEGGAESLVKGMPALPGFRESIVIPASAEMAIRVLASEYRDFQNVRIVPSKGPITRDVLPSTVPWEFADAYGQNAWIPAAVASLGEPYILRDERGVVVAVDPFQWNPATQTLRVYTSITVEVKAMGPGGANVLTQQPEHRVSEFQKIYARHFLNWNTLTRYTPVGEVGPMLVVAHDDFMEATQPLVDWKNQMGVPTTLVPMSSIGTTATQLKTYIQNLYDTEGVCFVLLVGDGAQIPYFNWAGGASDPTLSLLAGNDNYPDAFVGRISAETVDQVTTQVERLVEYESSPDPEALWYSRGVAIASNEGDGYGDEGQADWEHAQIYRAQLLAFTYNMINELYDGNHPSGDLLGGQTIDQPGNPTAASLSPLLNAGRGFIHYTGHGSITSWATTGFNNSNINALTNDNSLPYVVSVGCVNGAFMSTTCFAETWMRATNGTEPNGAIAVYASTVNQQWATPMEAQDEMINVLCDNEKFTFGGTCFNGSCSMMDRYGSNGVSEFKNWTIFGDPSVQMRTATPTDIAATYADHVDPAVGMFEVTTEPRAMVAISHEAVLYGSAIADEAGLAVIAFDPVELGALSEITLTTTGFNHIPNVALLPVFTTSTAVGEISGGVLVGQNQPNPFDRSTEISLVLSRDDAVRLEIYDVAGRKIRTVHDGVLAAGSHALVWDGATDGGNRATAGTYFYRLSSADGVETRRMVLLR